MNLRDDPADDLPSANEPIPEGTMTASEVMEKHVVEEALDRRSVRPQTFASGTSGVAC